MDLSLVGSPAHMVQSLAFASLVIALLALFPKLDFRWKLSKLPKFGSSKNGETQHDFFLKNATQLYHGGYKKFKDFAYRMAAGDESEFVVLPTKFLPELKKYPDDVLDNGSAVNKILESKYLGHSIVDPIFIHSVRADLTPALTRLNDGIAEEVDLALERAMPPCKDWTEMHLLVTLADVVAQVSGRIFVGPEVCRDPEFIDHAINFTSDFMAAVFAVKNCPSWLRPFKGHHLPEVKQLKDRTRRAAKFFEPIILERLETEQKPDDMLQWLLGRVQSKGLPIVMEAQVKRQLTLTFTAIHTTSSTVTNILHALAIVPEYIEPLREEIRSVKAAHGGDLNPHALQQLVKLDSFMKEVTRFCPISIVSFQRFVLKSITLSNGQHIPAGVMIEVPLDAINHDTNVYPDAENFDGFRFYKLRQSGSQSELTRSQFVSSNERDLFFGYGKHACPGRFFAANEAKIILTRLLMDYDIRMPDGVTKLYEQIRHEKFLGPDPTKPLLFKRIH